MIIPQRATIGKWDEWQTVRLDTVIVSTVPSSGTISLLAELKASSIPHKQTHCCKQTAKVATYIKIFTTYRDPLRVAASWCNRDVWDEGKWFKQWHYYHKIIKYAKVFNTDALGQKLNTCSDRLGLHKALDDGDMDYYYSIVPERCIDYAKKGGEYKDTPPIQRHYNILTREKSHTI